jgi:8-oxo-dGTP pyrophosphatase MutT (NUDIX family)
MLRRSPTKRIMPDVWMAPGGHRAFCEGLFACAKREVREETGLEICDLNVRAVAVAYLKDLNLEFHLHLLTAERAGGVLRRDPNEGVLAWLTPAEIYRLDNVLAELRYVLPRVFDDSEHMVSYRAVYECGNRLVDFALESS